MALIRQSMLATADIKEGVDGADWVLLVGSIPRGIVIDGKKNRRKE